MNKLDEIDMGCAPDECNSCLASNLCTDFYMDWFCNGITDEQLDAYMTKIMEVKNGNIIFIMHKNCYIC